jgi:hypothetical protein
VRAGIAADRADADDCDALAHVFLRREMSLMQLPSSRRRPGSTDPTLLGLTGGSRPTPG